MRRLLHVTFASTGIPGLARNPLATCGQCGGRLKHDRQEGTQERRVDRHGWHHDEGNTCALEDDIKSVVELGTGSFGRQVRAAPSLYLSHWQLLAREEAVQSTVIYRQSVSCFLLCGISHMFASPSRLLAGDGLPFSSQCICVAVGTSSQ